MPLIKGASAETARKNYKELLQAGYPQKQAYAITINTAKKYINKVSHDRKLEILAGNVFGDK